MSEFPANQSFKEKSVQPVVSPDLEVSEPLLFTILWERRWSIVVMVVVCLAARFVYVHTATPIFRSTARLFISRTGPVPEAQTPWADSKNYLYTQAEIIGSSDVLSRVLTREEVTDLETLAEAENKLSFLKKKCLDVAVGSKDDIISVSCESPYPEEAAVLANAVVEAYKDYTKKKKKKESEVVQELFKVYAVKYSNDLDEALKKIEQFHKQNGILAVKSGQENFVEKKLWRLEESLSSTIIEAIKAKAFYEALLSARDNPPLVRHLLRTQYSGGSYYRTPSEEIYVRERQELTANLRKAEYELLDLRQRETADSPRIPPAEEKVASLKKQLEEFEKNHAEEEKRFVEAAVAAAEQRCLTIAAQQKELKRAVEEQKRIAEVAIGKQAELAKLESKRERARRMWDVLESRIGNIQIAEDTGALNIAVIEEAKPELSPAKPKKLQTLALALVAGLMLGVGLALLRDWLDQRLRSAEEVAATVGAPVLGIVPHIPGAKIISRIGRMVELSPNSRAAEAFRTVRTAVYFGIPGDNAKTILVTSPQPEDGKSSVASNLAIAMAQSGQRILLAEADFRKPVQGEIFEVKNAAGFSSVLMGKANLKRAIRKSPVKNLYILPCGPIPPNPAELLNSELFREILEKLAGRYDRIVIDAPPLEPVADARILGALADSTIVVVRAEKSTRKGTELARESLLSVGANIIGAVVNDVPRRQEGYAYYGSYGGYRYYGREADKKGGNGRTSVASAGNRLRRVKKNRSVTTDKENA